MLLNSRTQQILGQYVRKLEKVLILAAPIAQISVSGILKQQQWIRLSLTLWHLELSGRRLSLQMGECITTWLELIIVK